VEAVAREASPRAGQDVLAALLAGLFAQTRHDSHAKRKVFFALSTGGVDSLLTKRKNTFLFGSWMTTRPNRFVVGRDPVGRSAVLQRGLTNVRSSEGLYWSATLWVTEETPVDNTVGGDRSQTPALGESLQPLPKGLICRALEIEPGAGFPMHRHAGLPHLRARRDLPRHRDRRGAHAAR